MIVAKITYNGLLILARTQDLIVVDCLAGAASGLPLSGGDRLVVYIHSILCDWSITDRDAWWRNVSVLLLLHSLVKALRYGRLGN